ncbi:hypothetical protein BGX29_000610 [Mortierella sp. GBA35]|nr:hypothetical protein BGX29_000610 [Mortierella sp. GBA35]
MTMATRTQEALHFPEVLCCIGSYLDPPALFSCVQTSGTWYTTLLSLLWETIDDSLYSWPAILKKHDTEQEEDGQDKTWLRRIFAKHGHLIRHLTIRWILIVEAASIGNTCNRLLSLNAWQMFSNMSKEEAYQNYNRDRIKEEQSQPLPDEFLVCPSLSEHLRPSKAWFWSLVQQNPSLTSLSLGWCLKGLCEIISPTFVHDILAGLKSLSTLLNHIPEASLERQLSRNPTLTSYRTILFSKGTLSSTFPHLQSLVTTTNFGTRDFFLLLRHLPILVHLQCGEIGVYEESFTEGGEILDGRPSRLQRLKFSSTVPTDQVIANYVLPWLPHLRAITCGRFFPATAKALPTLCPDFEVIRQHDATALVYNGQTQEDDSQFLLVVLQECLKLRVFDAIHHQIAADDLVEKPWACEGSLETFRCQVIGVQRNSKYEESMFSRISQLEAEGKTQWE